MVVPRERCLRTGGIINIQQSRLHQHLKAVANAEHQLAGGAKLLERIGQLEPQLVPQNAARGDVIAIAEAAGKTEDLKLAETLGTRKQFLHMQPRRRSARLSERIRGLFITVHARSAEN